MSVPSFAERRVAQHDSHAALHPSSARPGAALSASGVNLSDEEFQLVVSAALTNREQDGRPDLEGAFKALKGVETAAHERYLESKKAPRAPAGTAGDRQFDTSTDEGRKEAMLAYMGEESQQ